MPSDPVTSDAMNCADCSLKSLPASDPLKTLARLPEAIFNTRDVPSPGVPGSQFDEETVFDDIVLGVVPPGDATPQYELARILTEEKDAFRNGWHTAEVLQLGMGRLRAVDGSVEGQCPHATGADLDRVGEQFGIGRPFGFTDCCYWRFVQLMLFQPGPTLWLLLDLSELFTGIRPSVTEEPARIVFTWPAPFPDLKATYYDSDASPRHWDTPREAFYDTIGELTDTTSLDAYHVDGEIPSGGGAYYVADSYPAGVRLADALALVKPAGVAVALVNMPRQGSGGCAGSTKRRAAEFRGRYAG